MIKLNTKRLLPKGPIGSKFYFISTVTHRAAANKDVRGGGCKRQILRVLHILLTSTKKSEVTLASRKSTGNLPKFFQCPPFSDFYYESSSKVHENLILFTYIGYRLCWPLGKFPDSRPPGSSLSLVLQFCRRAVRFCRNCRLGELWKRGGSTNPDHCNNVEISFSFFGVFLHFDTTISQKKSLIKNSCS